MTYLRLCELRHEARRRLFWSLGRVREAHTFFAAAALVAVALVASPLTAHAGGGGGGGGAIGWANAVTQFSTEGTAVGAAAVVLGIIATGAILMFGITGLITTVVMMCLGGALMANAANIGSIFGAGGGGGSFRDALPASAPAPALAPPASYGRLVL